MVRRNGSSLPKADSDPPFGLRGSPPELLALAAFFILDRDDDAGYDRAPGSPPP